MKSMRVRELAEKLNAPFEGDGEVEILRAMPVEEAGAGDLAFAAGAKAAELGAASGAECLIVDGEFAAAGKTVIRAANPRTYFAQALAMLYPVKKPAPGVDASARIAESAKIGAGVSIAAFVSIGEGAEIGDGCTIGAGCAISDFVKIGEGSVLHARVTVYERVTIGKRAILHAGVVLGADGFGFVRVGEGYQKFPQVGIVSLGDDVEIGANSTVDRAALGVTRLGNGVKLDNMVHIGHNCRIEDHVVIAAQTGISGGCVIEKHAVIGGQVGMGDKVRIESGVVVGSGAGILTSKIVRGGETYWGTPARPLKQYLEQLAQIARLSKLVERVKKLEEKIAGQRDHSI